MIKTGNEYLIIWIRIIFLYYSSQSSVGTKGPTNFYNFTNSKKSMQIIPLSLPIFSSIAVRLFLYIKLYFIKPLIKMGFTILLKIYYLRILKKRIF